MKANHVELWERLERFQIDAPEASLPFSARLARENNWTPAHSRRVIEEYKRFAFLAVTAGHPVSPSEDVDQAWHLLRRMRRRLTPLLPGSASLLDSDSDGV